MHAESAAKISSLIDDNKSMETKFNDLRSRYAPIIDQESVIDELKKEERDLTAKIEDLRASYSEKHEVYKRLTSQVAIYDERLAFAELGIYEPHFDFDDSEAFKKKIGEVVEEQKAMISGQNALQCPTSWTVDGSIEKGRIMTNRQMRLSLRAFNNECDVAIANVRWNNALAMEKRILAAEKAINRENSSMKLVLNSNYVQLKLEELRLTHEYREQIKKEKDERTELARAEREEKKLIAEAEASEREERKYQDLLEKARKAAGVDGARIAELESALAEAQSNTERARAMAEMTKSGYVYIISNVGSFGEDVVKIGLTRRLNPDDRVKELGDASVPFGFDIHAMIYSDDAPALEAALHREFAEQRINMSNMRKEFFHITLSEVETAVGRLAPNANFFKDCEAQEWHETLARRKKILSDIQEETTRIPDKI